MVTGKLEALTIRMRRIFGALGGLFLPQPISPDCLPRKRSGKLAPSSLIFHNETDWAYFYLQGLLNVSRGKLLRRVNSMDKPNGRLVLVS